MLNVYLTISLVTDGLKIVRPQDEIVAAATITLINNSHKKCLNQISGSQAYALAAIMHHYAYYTVLCNVNIIVTV